MIRFHLKRKLNSRFQVLLQWHLSMLQEGGHSGPRDKNWCSGIQTICTDHLLFHPGPWFPIPRIMERHGQVRSQSIWSTVKLKCRAWWEAQLTLRFCGKPDVWSESSEGKRQALVTSDGTLVIHNHIYDLEAYKVASSSSGQGCTAG